jgi:limonene-1,2-epoxide hydrolase
MNSQSTRREIFFGGGLAMLAAATNAQLADAKGIQAYKLSAVEMANVTLVREFLASWDREDLDIDKLLARYIAPNAPVRWFDSAPAVFGPEAAAIEAKKGTGSNFRVAIDIHDVFARGPLVATSRVDTIKVPGKPNEILKAVGVCIVRDGQFHEYCDYIVK